MAFCRLSFGLLMVVYSANKCTDPALHQHEPGHSEHQLPFASRVPPVVGSLVATYPWFTTSSLYWRLHAPLLLVSAVGMALTFGHFSRLSCLAFSWLKIVLTLHSGLHTFNNHEYLYSLVALLFALVDVHDVKLSFLGQAALCGSSARPGAALTLALGGCGFAAALNAIHGIPGAIGASAMMLGMWPGVLLLLSAPAPVASSQMPQWHVHSLRLCFGLVYLYAGLAKLSSDWLQGLTLRSLLSLHVPAYMPSLIVCKTMAAAAAALDLSLPWALWSPNATLRWVATLAAASFHLATHFFFVLETFPWVMLSGLAVFHGDEWIASAGTAVSLAADRMAALPFPHLGALTAPVRTVLTASAITLLLALHVLVPLPCGLHAWGDSTGSLTWGSQCQQFCWWMMTRTVRTVAAELTLVDAAGLRGSVPLSVAGVGRILGLHDEAALADFCRAASSNEDRLWQVASSLARAASLPDQPPVVAVYAEIWLEVNGPPAQRFVLPDVNLLDDSSAIAAVDWTGYGFISRCFERPPPLAHWVLPRIPQFRTTAWSARFDRLARRVFEADASASVLFVADSSAAGPVGIAASGIKGGTVYVQLLSGRADVLHLGPVAVGTCIALTRGMLVLQALDNQAALWMLVTRAGTGGLIPVGPLPPPATLSVASNEGRHVCAPPSELEVASADSIRHDDL